MATITTIDGTDRISDSRSTINTNFDNLNTDKAESSTVTAHTGASTGVHGISGSVVGTTDTQTLTNKTLTTPTITVPVIASFASANHDHTNSAGGGTLGESALVLADNTTNNASASKHGFLPKLSGSASDVFKGDGTFGVPAGFSFVSGVLSDLVTTSAGNNDASVTTTFTPRLIYLYYFIQGWDGGGVTGYTGRKGIAVYNGTTLQFDYVTWNAESVTNRLTGDDGTLNAFASAHFPNSPVSTAAPTTPTAPVSGQNYTTLSIASVSSSSFVVRRATTIGDGTKNCRAKVAYVAFS